jgi:hypothetical protein
MVKPTHQRGFEIYKESPLGNRIDYVIENNGKETTFISHNCNSDTLWIRVCDEIVDGVVCTRMGELVYHIGRRDLNTEQRNLRDAKNIFEEVKKILNVQETFEKKYHCNLKTNSPQIRSNKLSEIYSNNESAIFNFLGIREASHIQNFFLD